MPAASGRHSARRRALPLDGGARQTNRNTVSRTWRASPWAKPWLGSASPSTLPSCPPASLPGRSGCCAATGSVAIRALPGRTLTEMPDGYSPGDPETQPDILRVRAGNRPQSTRRRYARLVPRLGSDGVPDQLVGPRCDWDYVGGSGLQGPDSKALERRGFFGRRRGRRRPAVRGGGPGPRRWAKNQMG